MALEQLPHIPNTPKAPLIRPPVAFGLAILIFFVGGFMLWATISPLESAAVAPGKIIVDRYQKTVQHLEGGIIKNLMVSEGKKVKAGELLIKLDDTQIKARLELVRNEASELLAAEARLIAERDNLDKINFPERFKNSSDAKIQQLVTSQNRIFTTRRDTLNGQMDILKQRVSQLNKEIDSLEAQSKASAEQLAFIKEEVEAVEYLEKKKLVPKPRLLALKREAARLLGDQGENIGLIAKARQKISETEIQMLTLHQENRKQILESLREVQKNLTDALEQEKAAVDILQRTNIVAPLSGTVVGLKKHTEGGVITPGQEVLNIVPNSEELIVEARVNPLDIDVIYPGLRAKVMLSAYKQRNTPSLEGTVRHVSADSLVDPNTQQTYYLAQVVLDAEALQALQHVKLYPGMPAQVMIITDKQTPLDYFITPIKETFDRAFREQ